MDSLLDYVNQRVHDQPYHFVVFTSMVLVILYILVVKRAYDPAKRGYGTRGVSDLTEREKQELIAEWTPEPLVSEPVAKAQANSPFEHFTIKEYLPGGRNVEVKVEGSDDTKVLFTSQDFLGLGASETVKKEARRTLEEYSLGSCGPRGFYGTTRKHLELEEAIAKFCSTPESITYSDAVATVASAIPAFAKRGDVLLVDAGVNHTVQTGCKLSRSKIVMFKHNDVADLRRQLDAFRSAEKKRKDSTPQRRFIVVEGLYSNYGDICPLRDIVELAKSYKWRVIMDDSAGFGVLGEHGRGTTEHFNLNTLDVDIVTGSLATTLASVGGFCVGAREVVDHQRLSGAGYCFSASAPPFLCATATAALNTMVSDPSLLQALRKRTTALHATISKALTGAQLVSDAASPIFHIQVSAGDRAPVIQQLLPKDPTVAAAFDPIALSQPSLTQARVQREEDEKVLNAIVKRAAKEGLLVTVSRYMPTEYYAPKATLKFCVTLAHTEDQINKLAQVLPRIVNEVVAATK